MPNTKAPLGSAGGEMGENMNKINKILWSAISAVICLVYKTDLRADITGCSYRVMAIETLKDTNIDASGGYGVCSAATLCGGTSNGAGPCGGMWRRDFNEFEDKVDYKQVCGEGQYVSYCGTDPYTGNGYCSFNPVCNNCPRVGLNSVAGTTNGVSYMTSFGGAAFSEYTIYVCSNYHPFTGGYGSALVMYEIYVDCSGYNSAHMNAIEDCFVKSAVSVTDAIGSYQWLDSCNYTE